jgi:hypothetical protein
MKRLEEARKIVKRVAEQRKRWGKQAGMGEFSEYEILEALKEIDDAGILDAPPFSKEEITKQNRAKGAAEARAKKYKGLLDAANVNIKDLTEALEDAENEIQTLRTQLEECLEK